MSITKVVGLFLVTAATVVHADQNPVAFYCSAACATYEGKTELRNIAGGRGQTELQAKVQALNSLRSIVGCSYGQRLVQCSAEYANGRFEAAAACNVDGHGNLATLQYGQGATKTEAEVAALVKLNSTVSCSYGAIIIVPEAVGRPEEHVSVDAIQAAQLSKLEAPQPSAAFNRGYAEGYARAVRVGNEARRAYEQQADEWISPRFGPSGGAP